MMWKEFEELAGYEVTYEDYTNVIEPMYMATDMNKRDFIKCIDRKRFDINAKRKQEEKRLVKRMKEIAADIKNLCGYTTTYDEWEDLRRVAKHYIEEFPEWMAPNHEFETARGYSDCTYITALVWYDKDWNEVKRIDLV